MGGPGEVTSGRSEIKSLTSPLETLALVDK